MYFGFIFLILSITISLLVDHVCTCEQLASKYDCEIIGKLQCHWDGQSCSTIACSSFDDNKPECIKFVGCAINDVGNCRDFTDCVDYHVDNVTTNCSSKWPTCVASNTKNEEGLYQCQEDEINYNYGICDKANETVCLNSTQADGKICDWDSQNKSCAAYDANRCSNIISQQKCPNNCEWEEADNICRAPYCSEILNETLCTYLRGDLIGTFQICRWDQTEKACSDIDDGITVLDFLDESNCLINTFFTATWNTTNCTLCQDGYSSLIVLGLATTLLFV